MEFDITPVVKESVVSKVKMVRDYKCVPLWDDRNEEELFFTGI